MAFSANPLSLSVPEPAFESWLRDSGYLEILDERTTSLHRQSPVPPPSTTTTTAATSGTPISTTSTPSFIFSNLLTLFSLFTINPLSKLTTDDFSAQTPSWTVAFIGSFDSYSFPSSSSQAKLRVHENIKRYARNYATLFLVFFACALYQMPVALFGLLACFVCWELFKWCNEQWGLDQYPALRLVLIRFAQCLTAGILYWSGVQMAIFSTIIVSYAVMVLHAALRKLSPMKTIRVDGNNKRVQQNRNRN